MSKYNILTEKLKKIFVGFYFDEEFEECPYIDLDKTDKAVLEKRYFGVDSFPMQMKANSAYGVLDIFGI